MNLPELNILAIGLAALIEVIIGAIWFNAPFAFNKQWLAGIGKTAEQVAEDASPLSILTAIIGSIISAVVLSVIIGWLSIDTWSSGLLVGVLIAIGFTANTAFIKDRFETLPLSLSLINGGHDIVVFGLMGAVIGAL